jgi:ankyrin repeat protein
MDNKQLDALLQELINLRQNTGGNLTTAYHLIKAGANPNITSEIYDETILWSVVRHGDIKILEKFVNIGCNIFHIDQFDKKPIDIAIQENLPQLVEWFLNHGIDINESVGLIKRIHSACEYKYEDHTEIENNNRMEIIKIMIQQGADLNESINVTGTPLDNALYFNQNKNNVFIEFLKKETEKQRLEQKQSHEVNLLKEEIKVLKGENDNLRDMIDELRVDMSNSCNELESHTNDFTSMTEHVVKDIRHSISKNDPQKIDK